MELATNKEAKPFMAIGELLSRSKAHLLERKDVLLPLALIPALFMYFSSVFSGSIFSAPFALLLGLVSLVLSLISTIALVKAVDNKGLDDWKALFSDGKNGFLSLLFIVILLTIVLSIGYLLLIIPGIYLSTVLAFTVMIHVLEGKKGWSAAEASMSLVKGHFFPVFIRILALIGAVMVFSILVSLVFGLLGGGNKWIVGLSTIIVQTVTTPFSLIYSYMLYKELKQRQKN